MIHVNICYVDTGTFDVFFLFLICRFYKWKNVFVVYGNIVIEFNTHAAAETLAVFHLLTTHYFIPGSKLPFPQIFSTIVC